MVGTGVFPVPPYKGGGTEQHIYELSNALAELGHEVHLVSDILDGAYFHKNIFVHRVKIPPASFRSGIIGWLKNHFIGGLFVFKKVLNLIISKEKFDVIHIHGRLAALLTSYLNVRPLVYTVHDLSPWMWNPDSLVERTLRKVAYVNIELRICDKVDHIIATSKAVKRDLVNFGIPKDKITIIPNGVDLQLFKPIHHNDHNYCLFVGQLVERKGVRYLLYALKKMRSNIKCLIIGDGPLFDKLLEMVKKLHLHDKVTFLGSVSLSKLVKLYQNAKFLVLPSVVEPFGIVVLEAMACGTPVIATQAGGPSDIIKHGYNGFLVKPKAVDDLAKYMDILVENTELRNNMAINARKTVEKYYSWENIATKVSSIYNLVIQRQKRMR